MKKFQKYFLLSLCMTLFGCASLNGKNNQEVTISTSPSEAYIYVDGWVAKTPVKLNLTAASSSYLIKVKKEGYKDEEVKVNRRLRYREVFLENLVWMFGYPIAVYVDFSNGRAFELQDTQIELKEKK